MADFESYGNPAKAHRLAEDFVRITYKGHGMPEQYAEKYLQAYEAILKTLNERDGNPASTPPAPQQASGSFQTRGAQSDPRRRFP